jgi:hypothetical protein
MHHGREEKRGLMMAPWTRIAIPIFVIAAAALGYLYFGRETACEQDPRSSRLIRVISPHSRNFASAARAG